MSALRRLSALVAVGALLATAVEAAPATASANPGGTVFVNTVPATPGISIDVDGTVLTTGTDGSISMFDPNLNGIASRVSLAGETTAAGDAVRLTRVVPGPHVRYESHLFVGLEITSAVRLRLVRGNSDVDPASVSRLRLRSAAGNVLDVNPRATPVVSLLARRALLQHGALVAQAVTWSVARIEVAPGVAVTTARARFDPLDAGTWTLSLQTVHGIAIIETVPAVAGVVLSVDGATVTTDQQGQARAPVADVNHVADRLQLGGPDAAGGFQVSNMRVNRLPPGTVRVRHIVVALDVRRPVLLRFVDARGRPVPPSRITDVTFTAGSITTRLHGAELSAANSMAARQATREATGWQEVPITYTLRSVHLNGGEAVFNGRQRFQAATSGLWTISLAVFTLTVTAHDALFGSQLGSRMVITSPDGSTVPMELSSELPRTTPSLVRGLYTVRVESAVLAGRASVLVSRDERIDLRVVTLWDTIAFVVTALAVLAGAVLGGRRLARRRTGRTS